MNDNLHLVGQCVTIKTHKRTAGIPGNTVYNNVLVQDCKIVYQDSMRCYDKCKKVRFLFPDNLSWCLDAEGDNGGYEIVNAEEFIVREDGSFCHSSR